MTDVSSGFFTSDYETLGTILNIVIFAIIIIMMVLSVFDGKKSETGSLKSKSFLGISQIILGASFLIEPFLDIYTPFTIPAFLSVLKSIFLVLSGIVFLYFGFSNFLEKKPRYEFMLIPIVLLILRLLVNFICYTGLSDNIYNIYEILMLCCSLFFFLESGKALCGIRTKYLVYLKKAFGVASILLLSICTIPTFILIILENSSYHVSLDSIFTNLFMMIYILAFLLTKQNCDNK